MSAGQYQGSQAFNHINPLTKDSINPNTGSLNLTTPLVKLKGIRSSIDLTVNLFYSSGFRGTFGLPKNWGLDLPYVLQGKSVTSQGRTYAVDPEWVDSEGYASGLKYTNNHGIKFLPINPPEPLPSGQPGKFGYTLAYGDGSVDYFDPLGKPMEHHDIYGNFIYYSYIDGEQQGVESPHLRLRYILDSWGQKVSFAYDLGNLQITQPDGGETVVKFSSNGVYAITDAAQYTISLEYSPFNKAPVLTKIEYPSGLTSRYDYMAIQYLNADGALGYLPAVEHFRSLDPDKNVLQHFRYVYGDLSQNTYTGASIGCRMGGPRDSLMDGDDKAWEYRYNVIIFTLDQGDNPVGKTRTWYNNLHLPIEETKYLLNKQGEFVDAQKTTLTYDADKKKRARITNYFLPAVTEVFCNTAQQGDPVWQAMTRKEAEYNNFGNCITSAEWLNVQGKGFIKQSSVNVEYFTTKANVQLPVKTWTRDEIAGTLEYREKKPSRDGKSVASETIFFQSNLEGEHQLQPWKEMAYSYDISGRPTSKTVGWGAGVQVPEGLIRSVTTKAEYAFDDGILLRTEIDGLGNATVFQHDMRQAIGPVVRKTLPRGQVEIFEYDRIGRLVKNTNNLGQQTTTVYTTGPAGSTETVTSPLKYSKKTWYDVLGRKIQVTDNGDPTIPFSDQPSRVLTSTEYDTRSLVVAATDRFGRKTKFAFDALARPVTVTDLHNNIITSKYSNGGLRVTQDINGDLRKTKDLDGLSRTLQEIEYPDSGDQSTTFKIVHDYTYNSQNKVIKKIMSQSTSKTTETATSIPLETETIQYGPDQVVRSRMSAGTTERGTDVVTRRYLLDLFDNKASYTKQTSYADGRTFTHQGPLQIFNENNQLTVHRNQRGEEERTCFDRNGWQQKVVRLDGTEINYTCDDAGRPVKIEYSPSATEYAFNADGKLIESREGPDIIRYLASLDGTLTGVAYSDGRTQDTTLDKFSRPVKEVDVFGVSKEFEYNYAGLVSRQSCQGDRVTYSYGTANHTMGQYLGCTFSGSQNYVNSVSYNGFGDLCQNTNKDVTSSTVLLDTTYRFDARKKVQSVKSASSEFPEQRNGREFSYDGLGQLVQESYALPTASVTKYAYDGNANVLSVETDGQVRHMTYNNLDQRTDGGIVYDVNGRIIQCSDGQKYTFDQRDRLLSTSLSADTPTHFAYRSDDRLASTKKGTSDSATFYHDAKQIEAIQTTSDGGAPLDQKTSLFFNSNSNSILAGYTDGQATGRFFEQLASTALITGAQTHTSATYTAYGVNKTSSSPGNLLSSFGFTQGYTDSKRGLVYLSSRFYSPKQMSFISMDTYFTENRYAYCEGDPVNRMDPTGHSWISSVATVAGIIVSIGVGATVTALSGGTLSPLAIAVIAGAVGGALGSVSTMGIMQVWGDEDHSPGDYFRGLVGGAVVGGISAGLGRIAGQLAGPSFLKAVAWGAGAGAATGVVKEVVAASLYGQKLTLGGFVRTVVQGAAIGAASGYWSRRAFIREHGDQGLHDWNRYHFEVEDLQLPGIGNDLL